MAQRSLVKSSRTLQLEHFERFSTRQSGSATDITQTLDQYPQGSQHLTQWSRNEQFGIDGKHQALAKAHTRAIERDLRQRALIDAIQSNDWPPTRCPGKVLDVKEVS